MFVLQLRPTVRDYATTVALLAVFFALRPGYLSVSLAFCVTMFWVFWKHSSEVTAPSLALQTSGAK